MSTQTATLTGHELATDASPRKSGVWTRIFKGFVEGREREARLRVSQHLQGMSDRHLRDIGFDENEIFTLRKTGVLPRPKRG